MQIGAAACGNLRWCVRLPCLVLSCAFLNAGCHSEQRKTAAGTESWLMGWCAENVLIVFSTESREVLKYGDFIRPASTSETFLSVHVLDYSPGPAAFREARRFTAPSLPRSGGRFDPCLLDISLGSGNVLTNAIFVNIRNRIPEYRALGLPDEVPFWLAIRAMGTFWADHLTFYGRLASRPLGMPTVAYAGEPVTGLVQVASTDDMLGWGCNPSELPLAVRQHRWSPAGRSISYTDDTQRSKRSKFYYYDKRVQHYPTEASVFYDRGYAYTGWGLHDRALSNCVRATELAPGWALAWACRAAMHEQLGQKDLAREALGKACSLDGRYAAQSDAADGVTH